MRLHKRRPAKVTSLQPVRRKTTLKLTNCHTSNEGSSTEVSGVLYWWMGCFLPPRAFFFIEIELPHKPLDISGERMLFVSALCTFTTSALLLIIIISRNYGRESSSSLPAITRLRLCWCGRADYGTFFCGVFCLLSNVLQVTQGLQTQILSQKLSLRLTSDNSCLKRVWVSVKDFKYFQLRSTFKFRYINNQL